MAVRAVARPAFTAPDVIFRRPFDVVGNQQIKKAVLVVVEPSGAGRPSAFVGYAGFGSDVGKGSVAVIVVKDGAVVSGYVEIGIAVIVEVSDGNTLAVMPRATHAVFFGDIGKGSVTVVMVEGAAQRMGRFVNVGGGGLDKKEIHQTVLIVVEPGDASAHGFKIVLFVGGGGVLQKCYAGGLTDVGVTDGDRAVGRVYRLCEDRLI